MTARGQTAIVMHRHFITILICERDILLVILQSMPVENTDQTLNIFALRNPCLITV